MFISTHDSDDRVGDPPSVRVPVSTRRKKSPDGENDCSHPDLVGEDRPSCHEKDADGIRLLLLSRALRDTAAARKRLGISCRLCTRESAE